MALNRLLSAAALAALLAGSAWLAQDAQANFADAAGFSGRGGATCISCHTEAPFPLAPPAATAVLEGLPEAWDVGTTYPLTVRVEGGPPAMPAPQPQGGFDLALDAGTVAIPPAFADLLRTPNPQEATYQPAGTLMREWQVEWTAPGLAERPRDVRVWLAVISANGNHVIASNASDGGERFDASAHVALAVPPSAAADAAWRTLPLAAPTAVAQVNDLRTVFDGRHADGNATHLQWRLDGGAWETRETGSEWHVRVDDVSAGPHTFEFASEGADRRSPVQALSFDGPGFDLPGGRDSPALGPVPLVLLVLALAAVALRSRP